MSTTLRAFLGLLTAVYEKSGKNLTGISVLTFSVRLLIRPRGRIAQGSRTLSPLRATACCGSGRFYHCGRAKTLLQPIGGRFSKTPLHSPAYCAPDLKVIANHCYPAGMAGGLRNLASYPAQEGPLKQ